MQNDVNSVGNNQWFYFSVSGMVPNKEYTLSVVNFTKCDSLFNYGMAPAVYSMVPKLCEIDFKCCLAVLVQIKWGCLHLNNNCTTVNWSIFKAH